MSPKSRGRPPGRGRSPKQRRPARQPTPLELILDEAEVLPTLDLLTVQVFASTWLGEARSTRTLDKRDADVDLVRALVAATRGRHAAPAYLALYALATIPDARWQDDVFESLAAAPLGLAPVWAVDSRTHVPEPAVGAQRWSDPWGSEFVYRLRFAKPVAHSLVVFETTVGGLWVNELLVSTPEDESIIEDLPMVEMDPEEALAEVADALWITDLYFPPQNEPEYTEIRSLAHWRTRGRHRDVDREHASDDERRGLIDDFIAAQDDDEDQGFLEVLADTFIDFGDGYLHDGVLAWSPGEVERFMLDWVHRKVLLEPDCVEPLPRVLARWVEFALSRRGLAPEHIAMVVNMVDALEEKYVEAAADNWRAGPAKAIMSRLLAEGTDLDDKEAVDGAVRAYNAERLARRFLEP
ncbi:hypothetical protein [Pengzhenrongella sp.]|jgi:hypothetical protein|uniref:hypothetical protein n=1 Tax=Pengzhenrongella sp. TaxID=2888820 RepID=UPI002F92D332